MAGLRGLASLSTDEVLAHIQQQMDEVMACAQEAASSAVTTENQARAAMATTDQGPTHSGQSLTPEACIKGGQEDNTTFMTDTDVLLVFD